MSPIVSFIEDELYKKIKASVPIFCMDLIIRCDNKILLIKRDREPAKNEFWTPGGRFLYGESISQGAVRKAKEETGLDCNFIKMLDICNMYFTKTGNMTSDVHTPSLIIEMEVALGNQKVQLDNLHLDYKWAEKNSIKYHLYVQEILNKAGLSYE